MWKYVWAEREKRICKLQDLAAFSATCGTSLLENREDWLHHGSKKNEN